MSKLAILAFIFTCTAAVLWTFNGATLLGIIAFATFATLAYRKYQSNAKR